MTLSTVLSSRQYWISKILGVLSSLMASVVWLATLATLFGLWARDDFVRYEYDDGEIVHISSIGRRHKPGFILGTAVTGILFVVSLICTKIYFDMENRRRLKRGVSIISIVFGGIAGISLILLSIVDPVDHSGVHYTFIGLFIVFTLLSAIFSIVYRFSRNEMYLVTNLRVSFVSFVTPFAITFTVLMLIKRPDTETQLKSVAACIEWSIAILIIPYLALFALDLLLN